ncbi:S8 family peptidase [Archangium violaceum]|uniref:S8 family peptidase n=1 Tax=Archangium violaceum TaxID=83451 RepID=UPI0037C1A043
MKKTPALLVFTTLLAACNQPSSPTTPLNPPPTPVDTAPIPGAAVSHPHRAGELILGYHRSEDLQRAVRLLQATVLGDNPALKQARVALPDTLTVERALGQLALGSRATLRYAQPNYTYKRPGITPRTFMALSVNDPLAATKWDLERMNAEAAWKTNVRGHFPDGQGTVIAVVDTGIDGTHPDLSGKFVGGWDASGCYDFFRPPSPGSRRPQPIPPNVNATNNLEHGTHVAGIAAALRDNAQGVVGVAPAARLMDVKVFCDPKEDTTTSAVIAEGVLGAILDRDGDGVVPDVITMSLGGAGYDSATADALNMALSGRDLDGQALPTYDDGTGGGVAGDGTPDRTATVTVAMGNTGQADTQYPAAVAGVIAVGATDPSDARASFSTTGQHISVSAPGVNILSTWPAFLNQREPGYNGGYQAISGTSMATPEVAGAVALIKQFHPAATPYQVRRLLERTAHDLGTPGWDAQTGAGRLDLKALVDALAEHDLSQDEPGGSARVIVTTANRWDSNDDGFVNEQDTRFAPPAANVTLLQGGRALYHAKTNATGQAAFSAIAPGQYEVIASTPDIFDFLSPYSSGDTVTSQGTLTVPSGAEGTAEIHLTSTLEITLTWAGGGDVDLTYWAYIPTIPDGTPPPLPDEPRQHRGQMVWQSVKIGSTDVTFSADDPGTDVQRASETLQLNVAHYPLIAMMSAPHPENFWGITRIGVDTTRLTHAVTATLRVKRNGVERNYGPIAVEPGADGSLGNTILWSGIDSRFTGSFILIH